MISKINLNHKKGVSPLIATIILVGLAVVIFGIIFFWLRSLIAEQVQKFNINIETQCTKLVFTVKADGSKIFLNNQGNIPILGVYPKIKINGKTVTRNIKKSKDGVVGAGETDVIELGDSTFDFTNAQERTVTPYIQGKTVKSNTMQRYLCKSRAVKL